MGEAFNLALEIARNEPWEASNFLKAYAEDIVGSNSECETIDDALRVAKSNLMYFSGYYGNDVVNLIHRTYKDLNPIVKF